MAQHNCFFRISLMLLLLGMLLPTVAAIGLYPGRVDMNYVPGFEKTFTYYVVNSMNFPIQARVETFYEGGRFQGALTVSKTQFSLGPFEKQPFYVTLKLPEKIDAPGESRFGVSAYEEGRTAKRGGVVVEGAVASVFHINGLYEGKYLQLTLSAGSEGEGQPADFNLYARSLGTETIENLQAKVEVYNLQDNSLVAIIDLTRTETGPLPSWYETRFTGQLSGDKMRKGAYRAVGVVYFDGAQQSVETYFRIGTQGLSILNYLKEAVAGQIHRFPITVESQYNLPYESVVAEVTLKDKETLTALRSFKTEPVTVEPFEQKELLGYLDLVGVDIGVYSLSIILRYGDEIIGTEGDFKVTDAEGNTERRSGRGMGFVKETPRKPIFTTTNILIGVIVLLIIINILWFVRSHRKRPPETASPPANPPPA